jgi:hypothetical protein
MIHGGDVAGEGVAGRSPGSGGASPYQRRGFPRVNLPYKLAFMGYDGVKNLRLFFSRPAGRGVRASSLAINGNSPPCPLCDADLGSLTYYSRAGHGVPANILAPTPIPLLSVHAMQVLPEFQDAVLR